MKKVILDDEVVEGRKGVAKRVQTAVALKGKMNSMVEPDNRGAMIALMVPWIWCRGRTCSKRSSGE